MNSFIVLTKKEFTQMILDYKAMWLPIVFIFLGLTQPIVTYFLPTILEALGGGKGITIDPSMTNQKGVEVLASTLGSQFDQLGIMIIVISMMGIIQSDKANGMLAFILTRPVSVVSYIAGKIISNGLIAALSVSIGYVVSYLYVNYLFTNVPFSQMITGLFFYLAWVLYIVTFTTMISTVFKSQGVIALISIVYLIGCRIIVGLNPIIDYVNPARMSKHATESLITGTLNSNGIVYILLTMVCILITLLVTYSWIANKKFNHE